MFSLVPPVTRVSQTSVWMTRVIPRDGLRQKCWRRARNATRKLIFSPSQWSRSRCVAGDASYVDSVSFGLMQVFTGAVPFSGTSCGVVRIAIQRGDRPPRPTHPGFTDKLWTLTQRCWDHDPDLRPGASEVSQSLPNKLVSCSLRRSYLHQSDYFLVCRTSWKQLIDGSLSKGERISLVTHIFSTQDIVELAECPTREDAQSFVDAVDEASCCTPSKNTC